MISAPDVPNTGWLVFTPNQTTQAHIFDSGSEAYSEASRLGTRHVYDLSIARERLNAQSQVDAWYLLHGEITISQPASKPETDAAPKRDEEPKGSDYTKALTIDVPSYSSTLYF